MSSEKDLKGKAKDLFTDVKDDSKAYSKKEAEEGKLMGVLSYILPPVPYFVEKKNKYVKYHAAQGMNLLIIAVGYAIIYAILTSVIKVNGDCGYGIWGEWASELGVTCKVTPWWVTAPLAIIGIGISILAIIGIINVLSGKAKELPIVNKLKIFK